MSQISYDKAKRCINTLDTDETAASAHGILCGLLCSNSTKTIDFWIDEIINNNGQNLESHTVLGVIFDQAASGLNNDELSFVPLTNQEGSLSVQIETLSQWCSGYLLGLGLIKFHSKDKDILEAMSDIALIAKTPTQIEDTEDNFQDFNQIFEHCRISALLIHQEGYQKAKQH